MKPVSDEKEPVERPAKVGPPIKLKSWLQIGLVLVVLGGLIGFAAYITAWTKGASDTKKDQGPPKPSKESIRYAFLDPPVREVEIYSENSQDYYFANPTSDTVTLRLRERGCICVHTVEVATWSMREALMYLTAGNAWQALGTVAAVEPRSWEEMPDLRMKQGEVSIPPADDPFPRSGIIRAHWKARAYSIQGKESVYLDVVSQVGEGAKFPRKLNVNYIVTRPFGFWPHLLDAGELLAGNKRVFECVVWSTTRDSVEFDVKLAPLDMANQADGCFVIGPVQEVPANELPAVGKSMGSAHAATPPRSAYRFTITVFENLSGQQLDLGPFHRSIVVSGGPGVEPIRIPVTGLVRGEIHVIGGDENDRIPLGSFRSDRGSSKTVSLVGPKSANLEFARVTGDAIKAKLEQGEERDGRRNWKLIVEAPPESFTGELQNAAVIIRLKTDDSKERYLRVPVTANAYR
jgi:hypothetical protein